MCEEADHNIYRTHTHTQTQSLHLIFSKKSLQSNISTNEREQFL